jgi:hypothetical protein
MRYGSEKDCRYGTRYTQNQLHTVQGLRYMHQSKCMSQLGFYRAELMRHSELQGEQLFSSTPSAGAVLMLAARTTALSHLQPTSLSAR